MSYRRTVTDKHQEILARHQKILTRAEEILTTAGYGGLTLDGLADLVGCSKGTLYNHFSSKEDLLLGVLERTKRARVALWRKASDLHATPRENMTALSTAVAIGIEAQPILYQYEQMIRLPSFWSKASEPARADFAAAVGEGMQLFSRQAIAAVSRGELVGDEERIREVLAGWIAIAAGIESLIAYGDIESAETLALLPKVHSDYLDGVPWRPLSNGHDYSGIRAATLEALGRR